MDPLYDQCKLSCAAHLCHYGGLASSITKFILHPSGKMLAGFAYGSVSVGSEAETVQFIECKMGSRYRWQ